MSAPSRRIVPSVGISNPAISRRSVVLPQPEGPSSVKNSPRWMSTLTLSSARTCAVPWPKALTTSIAEIATSSATPAPPCWTYFDHIETLRRAVTSDSLAVSGLGCTILAAVRLPPFTTQSCSATCTKAGPRAFNPLRTAARTSTSATRRAKFRADRRGYPATYLPDRGRRAARRVRRLRAVPEPDAKAHDQRHPFACSAAQKTARTLRFQCRLAAMDDSVDIVDFVVREHVGMAAFLLVQHTVLSAEDPPDRAALATVAARLDAHLDGIALAVAMPGPSSMRPLPPTPRLERCSPMPPTPCTPAIRAGSNSPPSLRSRPRADGVAWRRR